MVRLIKVGLCSIISPTQASKALLFARATATVYAIVPFEVPLTSVRLKYKWFVQPKLQSADFPLMPCFNALLQGSLNCLSCAARPDIGWKGGAENFSLNLKSRGFRRKLGTFSGMLLFLSHVHFDSSYSTSHFLRNTSSVERAALSSLYVPFICSFLWFLCLKPVLIGHVNTGRVVLHRFSYSSVKGFVVCKGCCNILCVCPFSFWLMLGWNLCQCGLLSQNFIKRFPSAMRSCLPLQSRDWLHGSGLCNTSW